MDKNELLQKVSEEVMIFMRGNYTLGLEPKIHTDTIFADDVSLIILPYVYDQYGN